MPANTARANPVVIMKTEAEPIKIQETNQVGENGSATYRVKMEEGSDRAEEPVAQNYSTVARSARIYQSGIFRNNPRGIHYLFYVEQ
ncbi:uncharacterized protein LOC124893423 isoform X2 [Capsicum annuum]|uniref:uncharacterized protein LOC124893423 isoform X2 n=1 Tax=Capsicum annuum TaxID=4072 RepID=UPI001FB17AD6|nr:uncharacterized protein LOC124893423 isoform X2 [Capsicum annuum]